MSESLPFDINDPDYDDPIVAEVHEFRRQIMEEFNWDRMALHRQIKKWEQEHPERMSPMKHAPIRWPDESEGSSSEPGL